MNRQEGPIHVTVYFAEPDCKDRAKKIGVEVVNILKQTFGNEAFMAVEEKVYGNLTFYILAMITDNTGAQAALAREAANLIETSQAISKHRYAIEKSVYDYILVPGGRRVLKGGQIPSQKKPL